MGKDWFNICPILDANKALNSSDALVVIRSKIYHGLQKYHCVRFDEMSDDVRELVIRDSVTITNYIKERFNRKGLLGRISDMIKGLIK